MNTNKPGIKHDKDKPRWDLIPYEQLEKVVQVLTEATRHYADQGWKKVKKPRQRYTAALQRHFVSYMKGEKIDPEFGLPHMAHLICNALILMWFDDRKKK